MAPADQPVHFLDRVHRSANGAVAVGIVLEVRLEDWFQHELGGGRPPPLPDRWNAERSLASVRLRYRHPPHRIGPVRLRNQFLAQARQPPLQARRLDPRKGHSVPARRTRICSGQRIGVSQDVLAVNLVVEQVEAEGRLRLRLTVQLSLKGPDRCRCCQAHRQSPSPRHLRKRTRSQGPLLRRHYPASTLLRPCPTPAMTVACREVEAATLARDGSPPITRTTFPTCRAHYTGRSSGCACRLLPRSRGLPQMAGGSASALSLSRPAQASHALRPAGSLSRPQATFVTRLRHLQLPARAARQLPDQSTTLRVESSSTDDPRLRGALPMHDRSIPFPHRHARRVSNFIQSGASL